MASLRNLFSASPLLLARLAGAGAGFLTQLILARHLPTEELGIFFAATSFAALAGLAVTQGFPGVAQRFMTRYREQRREGLRQEFVALTERETTLVTATVTIAIGGLAFTWPGMVLDRRLVLTAAALCIAAASSFTMYGAFASVERRFALAQLPETLIRPMVFLAIVWAATVLGIGLEAGAITACYAAVSVLLAWAQYAVLAPDHFPARTPRHPRLARHWRREGRTVALAVLFATSFADLAIFLASPFLGTAGLAPFGVALKIALLIGFAVQIAHQVALPNLADAHERGDAHGLAGSLLQATVLPSLVTGVCLVGAGAAGEWFLGLFGPQYTTAKWSLVILLAAQFLRALAGPGQSLLMLKGAQVTNAAICAVCCLILILANAALIPLFGLPGASFAVLLAVGAWAGGGAYVLWKRNGMRVDLLFLLRSARVTRGHS